MLLTLKTDERDGCVAILSGCGIGGHVASFRFLNPDYDPDPIPFDGDEISYARPGLHASVIATCVTPDIGELRATLEAYSPDSDLPQRSRDGNYDPAPRPGLEVDPVGGVTAAEQEGDFRDDLADGDFVADDLGDNRSEAQSEGDRLEGDHSFTDDAVTPEDPNPDAITTGDGEATDYDPGEYNVEDVLAYLADHPEAAAAIFDAEAEGKERKGVLDAAAAEVERQEGAGGDGGE